MANGQLTQVFRRLRRLVTGAGGDATDQQLLERYAAGRDEEAFAALVRRHGPMVHGVCRRILGNCHDADDAFQATFLVLARKASTVVWRASVGNWLHGVAYRTAHKLRVQSARRARHEQRAAALGNEHTNEHPEARELRQVLDEELVRLPERFRMPLLLCCLQDQTIDEAAQQLGCSFATVKGRVQRGREMLSQRLQRRGVALSAGVLAAVVSDGVGAAVPPLLVSLTVKSITVGPVSEPVAVLGKGVLQAMFREKLVRLGVVVVVVGLIGAGVGLPLYRAWAARPAAVALAPNADEPARQLPAEVRGQKVLAVFSREAKPRDDEVKAPLQKAGAQIVQQLPDDGQPGALRLLLDTGGKDPAQVLAGLPRFTGAIVFQDAQYSRGLAPDNPPAGQRKGQVPAAYAIAPASMPQQMPAILERLNKLPGVKAEHIPSEGKGVGYVKLTPRDGKTTLLEVFLRTRGDFNFVDPAAAAAKEGKPSEPAEKDGLSVVVTPTRAVFAPTEPVLLRLAYKNTSDRTFKLFRPAGDYAWKFVIVDAQSKVSKEVNNNSRGLGFGEESATLKSGETVTVLMERRSFLAPAGSTDGLGKLPVGKYRVDAHIGFLEKPNAGLGDPFGGAKKDYWFGNITTRPAEFEVAEDKPVGARSSEPAVKDGLSVVVRLPQGTICQGDALRLQVIYTNVGKEALTLKGADYLWNREIQLTDGRLAQPWSLRPLFLCNTTDSVTRLEPGKSFEAELTLEPRSKTYRYEFVNPMPLATRQERKTPVLSAGRYRLTVGLQLPAGDDGRAWAGKITSQPVELEVADPPEEQK